MDMATARDRLVDSLVANDIITKSSTAEAMRAVPRHKFVDDEHQEQAYQDRPLPIGNDQTISAPHMVGQMLDLIGVEPGDRVLEIGTGCGYHAAVTSEVVGDSNVFSVEYDTELGEAARERLDRLGYDVAVRIEKADRRHGPVLDLVLAPGLAEQVFGPKNRGCTVGLVSKKGRRFGDGHERGLMSWEATHWMLGNPSRIRSRTLLCRPQIVTDPRPLRKSNGRPPHSLIVPGTDFSQRISP